MAGSHHAATRSTPPEQFAVFPLTGTLLLPGMRLPLNIFEPRYVALVEDAQAGERGASGRFGMIQPLVPRQDNRPAPESASERPDLYEVGCLGRIEQCARTADGRFVLTLLGETRFRIREELPPRRGYRRVRGGYEGFAGDLDEPRAAFDSRLLVEAVVTYAKATRMKLDLSRFSNVPGVTLLNGLAMSLPFGPAEKQALLEAPSIAERERLLLALLAMAPGGTDHGLADAPPTVN